MDFTSYLGSFNNPFIFWGILVAGALVATEFAERNRPGSGAIVSILLLAFISVVSDPIELVMTHPSYVALGFLGYVLAGACWGAARFVLFTYDTRRKVRELGDYFMAIHNIRDSVIPDNMKHKWRTHLAEHGLAFEIPLKIREHKARIVFWMMLWPVSIFWFAVNQSLRRAILAAYNSIAGWLQNFSDKAFADMSWARTGYVLADGASIDEKRAAHHQKRRARHDDSHGDVKGML